MKPSRHVFSALAVATLAPLAPTQNVLWEAYGGDPLDEAGRALAGGADFDQDGFDDLVVGVPYADTGAFVNNGLIRVVSGASGATLFTRSGGDDFDLFGWAVAAADDMDGDGHPEVVVGAPEAGLGSNREGMARVFSGRTGATLFTVWGDADGDEFGYAVVGRLDRDGDGVGDFVVGAPGGDFGAGSVDGGYVRFFSGLTGVTLQTNASQFDHSRYGTALATGDVTGDGVRDLVTGVPAGSPIGSGAVRVGDGATHLLAWQQFGESAGDDFGAAVAVRDLDGDGFAEVIAGAPGHDGGGTDAGAVRVMDGASTTTVHTWYGDSAGALLGSALDAVGDVDEDGLADLVLGAPGAAGGAGGVRVHSGATLAELYRITGPAGSALGSAVSRAGDFDGDGLRDFAVGAPLADDPSTGLADVGLVRVHSGSCPPVQSYCTAGTSASGCQAVLSSQGTPSATAASGFLVRATGVEGSKTGIFFYGANGRQATPWGNGSSLRCVVPPVNRGGLLSGGGTAGQCDGVLVQDLNARWCSSCPKPQHNPGLGTVVQLQLWYRDPQNTSNQTTSLSDALEFVVCP